MSESDNIPPPPRGELADVLELYLGPMRRKIDRLERSVLIQNEQHIFDLDRIDRLRAQVKEFRETCDPKEEHVLVTAEEMGQ